MGDTDRLVEDGLPHDDGPALGELGDSEALSPEARRLFDGDLDRDDLEIDKIASEVGDAFDADPTLIAVGITGALGRTETEVGFQKRMRELVHETADMDAVDFTDEIGGLTRRLLDGNVDPDDITFARVDSTSDSDGESPDSEAGGTETDERGDLGHGTTPPQQRPPEGLRCRRRASGARRLLP